MGSNITEMLRLRAQIVSEALSRTVFSEKSDIPALLRLQEAMAHGALGGGKRLRPFLVLETAGLFGVEESQALPAATAIEMIHCYSLIHDDLPAMDDADTRRGQPSVHKAYDEAIAILAGDGLLTDAFMVLTAPSTYSADVAAALVYELSRGAGSAGMVGGQMMDLYPGQLTEDEIAGIQKRKTGALIEAAAVMGGIIGRASEDELCRLRAYAASVGEAFQVVDDILDVTQSAEALGKPAGADDEAGKATYVSLLGLEGARDRVGLLTKKAEDALAPFGDRAAVLRDLAHMLADRSH
ncbi:polyprenyl synthetase family protein [Parvularcula marina]|uniref:polyprenyl synthetase family protein n=1 Tax=Parvularcula marina TaxID=2292771 RepID=UPI003519AEF6